MNEEYVAAYAELLRAIGAIVPLAKKEGRTKDYVQGYINGVAHATNVNPRTRERALAYLDLEWPDA